MQISHDFCVNMPSQFNSYILTGSNHLSTLLLFSTIQTTDPTMQYRNVWLRWLLSRHLS